MNLEYWLRLSHARNLAPRQCAELINHFGGAKEACTAAAADLKALGMKSAVIKALQNPDRSLLNTVLQWGQQENQTLLSFEDNRYPPLLKSIPDPPPVLFVRGDVTLLCKPQIALVGSRNPSPGGYKTAFEFAAGLVAAGVVVTSGLALGIDGAGHRGALSVKGFTLAVLGSGLDCIYPARHQSLAEEIALKGAIISEFAPRVPPLAAHFPRRNRIISGLSLGVCVVEAALRSGSLITAQLAADQGREVFAVPGSIYNPLTQGCHALIQNGAQLVADVQEILFEFKLSKPEACARLTHSRSPLKLDSSCRELLQWVGFETTTIDEIVQNSGRSVSRVSQLVSKLELQGYIQKVPGGYTRAVS